MEGDAVIRVPMPIEVLYADDVQTNSVVKEVYNSKPSAIDTSISQNMMSAYNEEFVRSVHCQLRFCPENLESDDSHRY
jgi:hypothetical protein